MNTEKEKMLAGGFYDASDPQLVTERCRARLLTKRLNDSRADEEAVRQTLQKELFAQVGKNLKIEPPFYCEYGSNIVLGNDVFFNFNCVLLDVAQVTIGDWVLFGPNVQVYTATHPLDWQIRSQGLECAKAISIASHVWIGGSAVLCPGITIGEKSVIGAGSVVTKDIPPGVFAAGNPCRIIRKLD